VEGPVWCRGGGAVILRQTSVTAVRNRISLRPTGFIHTSQHSLPTNELCQYTPYGFGFVIYGSARPRFVAFTF